MNTSKLTLRLDAAVIQRTKRFAKQRHTTLSGMVEDYFRALAEERRPDWKAAPLVRELSGIAPAKNGRRWRTGYGDYLLKKYSL